MVLHRLSYFACLYHILLIYPEFSCNFFYPSCSFWILSTHKSKSKIFENSTSVLPILIYRYEWNFILKKPFCTFSQHRKIKNSETVHLLKGEENTSTALLCIVEFCNDIDISTLLLHRQVGELLKKKIQKILCAYEDVSQSLGSCVNTKWWVYRGTCKIHVEP